MIAKPLLAALCATAALLASAPAALAEGEVTVVVHGKGDVTAPGITCDETGGSVCSQRYFDVDREVCNKNDPTDCQIVPVPPTVTFSARPDRDGYAFHGWSGCTALGPRTCRLTVTSDATIDATFDDITPPAVSGLAPPAVAHGPLALAAQASDNSGAVSKVEFRVGSQLVVTDTTSPYTATIDTTQLPDGSTPISATAFDAAGLSAVATATTKIDNTLPALSITVGPDGQTFGPGSTQSWTFAASDVTSGLQSVQCAVAKDGAAAAFGPCTSAATHTVTGLGGGGYALSVRARDAGGLERIATRRFTIDATPPDTAITAGPADGSSTTATSATFAFTASEPGASFACRVFPAALTPPAFGSCSASNAHTASGFAPGTYAFEVRATDAFGNADASPARRVFIVTAPALTGSGSVGGGGGGPGGSGRPGSGRFTPLVLSRFITLNGITRFLRLKVRGLRVDATVRLECSGGGCPFKAKAIRKHGARLNLLPLVKRARFRGGSLLLLKLAIPSGARAVASWKMFTRDVVRDSYRCAPPGGKLKVCD